VKYNIRRTTQFKKDVYDLFYEFYNPLDLTERESVYNVVINPRIDYRITETFDTFFIFRF